MFGFNDPFSNINSIMNQFMMDPFAPPNQRQQRGNNSRLNRNEPFDPFAVSIFDRHNSLMHHNSPFSLINQMMGSNMDSVFRNPDQFANSQNSQVYSSSSVISYSNSDGKPKVFQQTKQIQQGPGGIRETREMVRDSERGIEKVAIGHHIGERAHVIERQKVNGQIEEIVNLENLDDDEVQAFNHEFESRIRSNHNYNTHKSHHHINNNQPLAIEDKKSKKDKDRKSRNKYKH